MPDALIWAASQNILFGNYFLLATNRRHWILGKRNNTLVSVSLVVRSEAATSGGKKEGTKKERRESVSLCRDAGEFGIDFDL